MSELTEEQKINATFEAVFGKWVEGNGDRRHPGILERMDKFEFGFKFALGALGILVLHSLGVPTQEFFGFLTRLVFP